MPKAEHVTLDLYDYRDSSFWKYQPSFEDLYGPIDPRIRLTLDYQSDFDLINRLLSKCNIGLNVQTGDLISFLNGNESILQSMAYNNARSASKP